MAEEVKRYSTDDPARVRAREEADKLIADPPAPLMAWMEVEGVQLVGKPSPIWANVEKRLRQLGLIAVAKIYIQEQVRELRRAGIGSNKMVAKEIVMRIVVDQLVKSKDAILAVHEGDDSEYECLPKHLRWVLNHPLLVDSATKDPVMRALGASYEREHKAPNVAALNLLRHCQEHQGERSKKFKEADALVMDWKKAVMLAGKRGGGTGGTATSVGEGDEPGCEKSAEGEAIELLDEELEGIGE